MFAPPHLPHITDEQLSSVIVRFTGTRVHRKIAQVAGLCPSLGVFTFGELWFWFEGDIERETLVPLLGMPYTASEEVFKDYIELSNEH